MLRYEEEVIQDVWGNSPLHYAAILDSDRDFKRLLSEGANPHLRNRMGATPLLMRELTKKRIIGNVEGYPLLADIYVDPSDIYLWWTQVKPGEKWTFLNLYALETPIQKRGDQLLVTQEGPPLGRRVFAKEPIGAGELICEYLGAFYPAVFYTQEMEGLFEIPKGLFKKAKRDESDYINGCINGREYGNEAALIGDGVPNVEFVPSPSSGGLPLRIFVRALSDIEGGEELTAYYMAHPIRYEPAYVELQEELRKKRIEAILRGSIQRAEEWFLRYLFHTPYLLIPLLLNKEISFKTYKILFDHLPEEVSWIKVPDEREWVDYVMWMGRALKMFSSISFPHSRLFFDSLTEMSFAFEKRTLSD